MGKYVSSTTDVLTLQEQHLNLLPSRSHECDLATEYVSRNRMFEYASGIANIRTAPASR